jgi:hypothetical protein
MKKLKMSIIIAAMVIGVSFNTNAQNTLHEAKVVGSFDLGNKEVTAIQDEVTGCVHKSEPHTKGLFQPNDNVKLDFGGNNQMAEIIKLTLPEQVYADRKCNGAATIEIQNPYDYVGILHNLILNTVIDNSYDNSLDLFNDVVDSYNSLRDNFNLGESSVNYKETNDYVNDVLAKEFDYMPELLSNFSNKEKEILNNIFDAGLKSSSLEVFEYRINAVLRMISNRKDISETNKIPLYIAQSVANHSVHLWEANQEFTFNGGSSEPAEWPIWITDTVIAIGVYLGTGDIGGSTTAGSFASKQHKSAKEKE